MEIFWMVFVVAVLTFLVDWWIEGTETKENMKYIIGLGVALIVLVGATVYTRSHGTIEERDYVTTRLVVGRGDPPVVFDRPVRIRQRVVSYPLWLKENEGEIRVETIK